MMRWMVPIVWVLSLVAPLRRSGATVSSSAVSEADSSCYWATWMERCSGDRTAWIKGGTEFFKEKLSEYGNDGYHLQTVEYGDGTWMGFFKKQTGCFLWRTRSSLSDFLFVIDELKGDGYSATALAYGDGQYMGWFRKQTGVDSWTSSHNTDDLWEKIKERHDEGFYLMSSATGSDGSWVTWFHEDHDGDHAAYRRTGRDNLHDTLDEILSDDEYVTSMAHAGDGWIIYTKSQPGTHSTWATRKDTQDMYEFIDDRGKNDDLCATAIGYSCTSLEAGSNLAGGTTETGSVSSSEHE